MIDTDTREYIGMMKDLVIDPLVCDADKWYLNKTLESITQLGLDIDSCQIKELKRIEYRLFWTLKTHHLRGKRKVK